MTALPQRVVLHQQLGSQLQTQLNGLWTLSRRLRLIRSDLSLRLSVGGSVGKRRGDQAASPPLPLPGLPQRPVVDRSVVRRLSDADGVYAPAF
jgi:hypothetical protein